MCKIRALDFEKLSVDNLLGPNLPGRQKVRAQFAGAQLTLNHQQHQCINSIVALAVSAASAHQQHQHQMLVRYWIYSANNWGIYVNQKVSVRPSGAELQNVFFLSLRAQFKAQFAGAQFASICASG